MGSDLNRILEELARQGWRIQKAGSGHWKCFPPDRTKPMVVLSGTPGTQGSLRMAIHRLKRSGFRWNG